MLRLYEQLISYNWIFARSAIGEDFFAKRRSNEGSQKVGSAAEALCPRLQGHSRSKRNLLG